MHARVVTPVSTNVALDERVAQTIYWKAFAPGEGSAALVRRIEKSARRPHFTLASPTRSGVEMRFLLEGRIGIAAVLEEGRVVEAFPFLQGGKPLELQILEVRAPRVRASWEGMELTFHDSLAALGMSRYQAGERRLILLNALALSLRRVEEVALPEEPDGEPSVPVTGHRSYLLRETWADEIIFQSPVEVPAKVVELEGRHFGILPVSLAERNGRRLALDVVASTDLVPSLPQPGEDVAGVVWLQGQAPTSVP